MSLLLSTSIDSLTEMALSPTDPNSFSRPDLAVVTHIHLNVKVNFTRKMFEGSVILDVEKKGDTNVLILDVRGLVILSITNIFDGSRLDYCIEKGVDYGSKLSVELPDDPIIDDGKISYKIKIDYRTSQDSTAIQWLNPEQTAGGKHPYLFSQCEAIHARSMLPCQDTPFVKSTYTAEITAPAELNVLMSAIKEKIIDVDKALKIHRFHQPVPIPSYLIAIAAGALVSKQIGPRTRVWTEKELLDKGAYEFEETEKMLKTAEDICGPYVWGVYDLLILPPSFPFGGMENPCLTFVTPTLLAGDRSLANVVAHEISHSWTGNLVTNMNFEHFWLNEGFTVFVERKILGRMYDDKVRHFAALMGVQSLKTALITLGDKNPLTNLVTNLIGIDPDDAFSVVPYEKGHIFLFYLEQLLGGPDVFEPFLRSYLEEFKYKSLSTTQWKEYLFKYFSDKVEVLDKVDWNAWFNEPGLPPVIPKYDTTLAQEYLDLAAKWLADKPISEFSKSDIENWTSNQKEAFLAELVLNNKSLSLDQVKSMSELYRFDSRQNSEIRFNWLRLCLKSRWEEKVSEALDFATSQGRLKFVRPLFQDIYAWEEMRQRAIDVYNEKKYKMMYVTREMVAKDLHILDKNKN
ncbi:leukotriene A-4 hydrolase [Copidosoma floridanum]|uniref:leukotriene A-4 hydrolase n=1 Tax=Copidosoma floridanum TaxID=29053 RepID=UPI0006C9D034|nr:leukotriene A-4 hydrolase [Copidosoma floridanum]